MEIIFGLALLTLVVANPTSKFNNAHEYMTDAELKSVFQTELRNGINNFIQYTYTPYETEFCYWKTVFPFPVPEYRVTPIYYPKFHKRWAGSLTRLSLNVFGRDIELLLNPTDGILAGFDTPVYHASRLSGLNVFKKLDDVSFKIRLLQQKIFTEIDLRMYGKDWQESKNLIFFFINLKFHKSVISSQNLKLSHKIFIEL